MHVSDIVPIGWVHVVACLIALATGAWNLALPKGTAMHKRVGIAYMLSMIVLNISVFWIYKFDIKSFVPFQGGPDTFGIFHWFAVAALGFITIGWYAARHQNRAFFAYLHPTMMILSYYDLVGGGINEVFARIDAVRGFVRDATGVTTPGPMVGMTHTAWMALCIVLIVWFLARVALWRRQARRQPALA